VEKTGPNKRIAEPKRFCAKRQRQSALGREVGVSRQRLNDFLNDRERLSLEQGLRFSTSTSSADEFLDAALTWFGDPDPRLGTAWEKGERLAKLVAHRRTLLVLDGLEPLQNPPGPQGGRVREPSLQALLSELAAFNIGLCVITTRLPVGDIADYEGTSAPRLDLEHLSSDAGAKLLRALGVKAMKQSCDMPATNSVATVLLSRCWAAI
jgi:hypothetical protein